MTYMQYFYIVARRMAPHGVRLNRYTEMPPLEEEWNGHPRSNDLNDLVTNISLRHVSRSHAV